jgi:transcription-repair coupling factor (superfamily II helicase)
VTEVIPYNEHRIKRGDRARAGREGQVYFVHNRVHNIQSVADDMRSGSCPRPASSSATGRWTRKRARGGHAPFMRGEADILVSTTIIESGIDIPTANTMIINDADRFGLADLHQLRGRVGRYKHRAYCYLLLPKDRTGQGGRPEAAQGDRAVLDARAPGFKIAMRDLEIRGAGNLLGAEQSGHIAAVGYEMYCQLLEQADHGGAGGPDGGPAGCVRPVAGKRGDAADAGGNTGAGGAVGDSLDRAG